MIPAGPRPSLIRVITRLNIGGPAQHVVLLTAHLAQRGFDCMLTTGRVDPHEGDMSDLAARLGCTPVVVPTLRNGAGVLSDLRSLLALYRHFRRVRPSIVHLHLLKARALGGLAARLARVPIVVETFHGTLFSEYYHPAVTPLLVWGERLLARVMDAVIVVSEAVAEEVTRWRIAPASKIRVIPLGLNLEPFRRATGQRGRLRAELGVDGDVPLIGAVGRLVPIKGLSDLIAASAEVLLAVPKAQFVIVGDGPERAGLERDARERGILGQVRFLGWRRNLHYVYPDLDVVVLPSLNEGTPVAVIEAMAAGRPVVATRVGGVPDVVRDGETGILVPPRTPTALVRAIIAVLQDRALGERLGRAAQADVLSRYAIGRLADEMEAFYRMLLQRRAARQGQKT